MRKLIAVVCAVVAIDAMLSTALAPLLPQLSKAHHLGKIDASFLVAAYYLGLASVAVPVILLASRISAKRATRDGIFALGLGTVAFALAPGFIELLAARWLQGAGAVLCWSGASGWLVDATPSAKRGYIIGVVAGVSSGGGVIGPVLGAIASAAGRGPTFLVLGAIAVALAAVTFFFPDPGHSEDSKPIAALLRALRPRDLVLALWLVSFPGTILSGLAVLGPLALSHEGWGAFGVAATYCGAAFAGLLVRPLVGNWADSHGRFLPIGVLLALVIPETLALDFETSPWELSAGLILAVTTCGCIWGPAMASLSDLCSRAGVSQTLAFALALVGMAPASVLGAIIAGASSQLLGDFAAYSLMAGVCACTILGASPVRNAALGVSRAGRARVGA